MMDDKDLPLRASALALDGLAHEVVVIFGEHGVHGQPLARGGSGAHARTPRELAFMQN